MNSIQIRQLIKNDLTTAKEVIDATGLFPSEMLDEMVNPYLLNENDLDHWYCAVDETRVIGIAFCSEEKLTDKTYNLYLIAVLPKFQNTGLGTRLLKHIEGTLGELKKRVLIVETSSKPEFEATRNFYLKNDYQKEAIIRDFYSEGDSKVVFWKKLIS